MAIEKVLDYAVVPIGEEYLVIVRLDKEAASRFDGVRFRDPSVVEAEVIKEAKA